MDLKISPKITQIADFMVETLRKCGSNCRLRQQLTSVFQAVSELFKGRIDLRGLIQVAIIT